MRIAVINGSPKGMNSITVHSVLYLEKLYKEHEFEYIDAGQKIKGYIKDFSEAKKIIERADLILFSYPVYTFIAPAQLHRFISLMKEYNVVVKDKFVTQITTSKHFYDVTAHRYIQDNVADMKMRYIKGLSADMDDLTLEKGQKELKDFFLRVLWSINNGIWERNVDKFNHFESHQATKAAPFIGERKDDVVVVTDANSEDVSLKAMIDRFISVSDRNIRVINLNDFPFRGGCLGCFRCASTGKCVYTDGFDSFLRETIQSADAIVYAFRIKDHSMGHIFKTYDDRQFCNGHRTVTMGSPVGYLISGPYGDETNLQMIIEGRANVGGNILCYIATDEYDTDSDVDKLSKSLSFSLDNKISEPQNFLGIGGMKIFRDLIYLMRGLMKADHRFFKSHGQYDFPHKKKGRIIGMYFVGALMSSPKLMAKAGGTMNEGMVAPYKKVLESLDK